MAQAYPTQNFWEPQMQDMQKQLDSQRAAQQAQYRQTMLQPQYGMDSHSGTRYPGMMAQMYRTQPQPQAPQSPVAAIPQPTPTTSSIYQREMATGGYGGQAPQAPNGLAAILANLFGFMNNGGAR
jgi:hypothetical protein